MAIRLEWLNQKILSSVDKFVPAEVSSDRHNKRRARVIVATLLFVVVFSSSMFVIRYVQDGLIISTLFNLLIPISSLYLLKVVKSATDINRVCDIGIVLITFMMCGTVLLDGGLQSRTLVWFPIMCIISTFVGYRIKPRIVLSFYGLFLLSLLILHSNNVYGVEGANGEAIGKFASTLAACAFGCLIAFAFERARVIDSEELKREKENALIAMKHKSEFLANMSHEIRTPMNGVIGMLGLLSQSNMREDQQTKLNVAQDSAESLLVIINDILDFSKLEAGKLSVEKIKFNLFDLLEEVMKSIAYRAQSKGLELILDCGELPYSTIEGDPNRLRQILNNILSNAAKFTSKGEVILSCWMEETDPDNVFYFQVKDTGQGIPKSYFNDLFEPFMQLDASTTRNFGGTGLGLSIVKQLSELMNGHIDVESREGEGSCFTVSIPMKVKVESRKDMDLEGLKNKKILIWDENKALCNLLERQLSSLEMAVSIASTLEEAKKIVAGGRVKIDCVLVDIKLLRKFDISSASLLNKKLGCVDAKAVLMSMIVDNSQNQAVDASLFHADLVKPFSIFNLTDLLKYTLLDNCKNKVFQKSEGGVSKENTQDSKSQLADNVDGNINESQLILLVEDDINNQQVIAGMLKGYNVSIASDGEEALEYLRESMHGIQFSLILMDCNLPGISGFEATKKIRQGFAGERYQSIPIIAITANVMSVDKKRCFESGMDDYLCKPISLGLFKERVSYWLSKREKDSLHSKPA